MPAKTTSARTVQTKARKLLTKIQSTTGKVRGDSFVLAYPIHVPIRCCMQVFQSVDDWMEHAARRPKCKEKILHEARVAAENVPVHVSRPPLDVPANPYEQLNRLAKAQKLAAILLAMEVATSRIFRMPSDLPESDWMGAAALAGYKDKPSLPTRVQTLEVLTAIRKLLQVTGAGYKP